MTLNNLLGTLSILDVFLAPIAAPKNKKITIFF